MKEEGPCAEGGPEGDDEEGVDADGWDRLMGGSIKKRVRKEGAGQQPEMQQDVVCSYEVRTAPGDEAEVLQNYTQVRYRIGENEAIPALELALRHMLPGEESDVYGATNMCWGDAGLAASGPHEKAVPPHAEVHMRVVLHECLPFSAQERSWNEQIQELFWRKANGNDHFKRKVFTKAKLCYAKGIEVFGGSYEPPDHLENRDKMAKTAASVTADIHANIAAACLETGDPTSAKKAAIAALEIDPNHVKGLYRGAKAAYLLDEFEECEASLVRGLQVEPKNEGLQRLQADFHRKRQRYATKDKRMTKKMFESFELPVQEVEGAGADSAVGADSAIAEPEGTRLSRLAEAVRAQVLVHKYYLAFCVVLIAVLAASMPNMDPIDMFIVAGVLVTVRLLGIVAETKDTDAEPKKES